MPTTKNAFAWASKWLYDSSGARVTDVNKIKEQYAEYKDTGSFQKGYEVRDLWATTPSSNPTWGTNKNTIATGGSTSPAPTIDDKINSVQDNQQKVDQQLIDAQRDAYNNNKENEQKIEDNFNQNQTDTANYAKENLNNTEEYYSKNEALIKQQNAEISAIEAKQEANYQARIDRDTLLLEEKKQSETVYLKAQQEKQRLDNAEAIRQAKVDVEIERQQSAWGYQKIGLGFSSGIINQSQQIATEGIMKIAEIKANMTMQEAQMTAKIADVEFNYANLVNSTIDTYTDKIDSVRKDAITRINETNQSLIKNTYDKKTDVDKIKEWARAEKLKAEQQHILDIQWVKDKWVEYLKDIQSSVQEYQKRELTKLDTALTNGTIVNMSPQEIAQKEASLWLPAGTIEAQMNTSIAQWLNAQITELTWVATMPLNPALIGEVKSEMKNRGMTWDEAVKLVVSREAVNNPELAQMISDKENTLSLEEKKFQLDIAKYESGIAQDDREFGLDVAKFEADAERYGRNYAIDVAKLELDQSYKAGQIDLDTYKAETARMGVQFDYDKLAEDQRQFDTENTINGTGGFNWGLQPIEGLSSQAVDLLNAEDGSLIPTRLSATTNPNGWKECAEFVNDITSGKIGRLGDTIKDKLNVCNSKDWEVGKVAVWNPWNNKYGHTGIIMWEDGDNWIIKSSNLKSDGKVSTDLVPKDSIQGYSWKAVLEQDERGVLTSKAVELGLDRKDIPFVSNADLASYITTNKKNKTRASISDATQPLLERIKKDSVVFWDSVDKDDVKSAYEALLKDWFTQDEALDQLTLANDELEIKNWVVYEKDFLTKDDYIFNSNKE